MYSIAFEKTFISDFKRVSRLYPFVKRELNAAVRELSENGVLPEAYRAHVLDSPGGSYSGHIDFRLSDGKVDVAVLYLPHKTNPAMRFVRTGTHAELFQGPER